MFSVIILMNLMVRMTIISLKVVITFVVASSIYNICFIGHNSYNYPYDNNGCNDNCIGCNGHNSLNGFNNCNDIHFSIGSSGCIV